MLLTGGGEGPAAAALLLVLHCNTHTNTTIRQAGSAVTPKTQLP